MKDPTKESAPSFSRPFAIVLGLFGLLLPEALSNALLLHRDFPGLDLLPLLALLYGGYSILLCALLSALAPLFQKDPSRQPSWVFAFFLSNTAALYIAYLGYAIFLFGKLLSLKIQFGFGIFLFLTVLLLGTLLRRLFARFENGKNWRTQTLSFAFSATLCLSWTAKLLVQRYRSSHMGFVEMLKSAETLWALSLPCGISACLMFGIFFCAKGKHSKASLSITVLLLCLSLWFLFFPPGAFEKMAVKKTEGTRPNIFVFSIDSLRADLKGLSGFETEEILPNICALKNQAAVFENNYVVYPATVFSIPSTLRSNALLASREASENLSAFRNLGYETAAFMPLSELEYNMDFGFDRYVTGMGQKKHFFLASFFEELKNKFRHSEHTKFAPANQMVDESLKWLKDSDLSGKSVFMFHHVMSTHFPYDVSAGYERKFFQGGETRRREVLKEFEDLAMRRKETIHEDIRKDAILLYLDSLRSADGEFGRFVNHLKQNSLYDQSIIAVTADHGESFGEGGFYFHGQLRPEQLRVPLIVKIPTTDPKAEVVDRDFCNLDLLPLLKELGAGKNISEALDAPALPRRKGIAARKTPRFSNYLYFSGSWCLTVNLDSASGTYKAGKLFFLPKDPDMKINAAEENPALTEELLHSFVDELRDNAKTGK